MKKLTKKQIEAKKIEAGEQLANLLAQVDEINSDLPFETLDALQWLATTVDDTATWTAANLAQTRKAELEMNSLLEERNVGFRLSEKELERLRFLAERCHADAILDEVHQEKTLREQRCLALLPSAKSWGGCNVSGCRAPTHVELRVGGKVCETLTLLCKEHAESIRAQLSSLLSAEEGEVR